MTKTAVIWAIVLIVAGLILTAIPHFAVGFDFTKLNTEKFTTNTHIVEESFQNIQISTKIGDIHLVLSDNDACRVECMESEKYNFSVSVVDNTLTIQDRDSRAWYEHIGIHMIEPKVTVYLPETAYEKLQATSTTGNVKVEDGFSFQNATLEVTTGDIDWFGSNATNMALQATTGDITLTDVATDVLAIKVTTGDAWLTLTTAHALSATASTGDILFDRFDARSMNIKATTGDVIGTLLTPKQFVAHVTTGDVQVPHSNNTTDTCKITVTTGHIRLDLA